MLKLFADDAKNYQATDKCDILQGDLSEGGSWADKQELFLSLYSASPTREDYVQVGLRLTVTALSARKRKE